MTVVSIMGPSIFSWAGLFAMIMSSDIFILYDDQPYTRNDRSNRNTIFTSKDKPGYITVPYHHSGVYNTSYDKLFLNPLSFKVEKFLRGYKMTYSRYPGYGYIYELFETLPFDSNKYSLINFQIKIFEYLKLNLNFPRIVRSSSLPYQHLQSNERVRAMLNHFSASKYISAYSSFSYNHDFDHGCSVVYQNFVCRPYSQPSKSFVDKLSFIDVISCIGISEFNEYCMKCNNLLSHSERSNLG